MSTTLHLECDTCKKSIWIGQRTYIYTGEPNTMKALGQLLNEHITGHSKEHALFFRTSHVSKYMDGQDGWENEKL